VKFAILGVLIALGVMQSSPRAPLADHHQHLFSPEAAALVNGSAGPGSSGPTFKGISAADLIGLLDAAGIQHALVLSMAYTWGSANRTVDHEYDHVRAENDWTSRQVAAYPDRLRAFCSVNPLKPYALAEVDRCAKDPRLARGLKLHFGNSDVDLDNAANVADVRDVFRSANDHHMTLVVHMHSSVSKRRPYGANEARVFISELLPAAPDVAVQIAHLAGSGGYDADTDAALAVFIDAIGRHDRRTAHLWFDVTTVVLPDSPSEMRELMAKRIREIGVERVLFGSDAATDASAEPRQAWQTFRRMPLTAAEFDRIAANVPPYMRW
jgi:predicted TIM-barrel fold metal-dependent hydrolase